MVRFSFSLIGSFVLLYIQSLIVMKIDNYDTIQFDNALHVLSVVAINFFLLFTMISHFQIWIARIHQWETEHEEN